MQKIAIRLYTWKLVTREKKEDEEIDNEWVFSIVRKYKSTLKITVIRDFEHILEDLGIYLLIEKNSTERIYKYGGRIVEFIGADDEQKIRWSKRDYLYCNEANELSYMREFFQLLIRTGKKIIIDFNPSDEDVWINTELELKRMLVKKDVSLIVSTYLDNPFLSTEEVKEIENIKNIDSYLWEVYGKWNYWKTTGMVYMNREIIDEVQWEFLWYWMDFWFSNDPTSIVALYRWNGGIVRDEILYKTGLTNTDIDRETGKLRNVVADSADPKSIEELKRMWRGIEPAIKWPDSISYGISCVKNYPMFITSRSANIIKEVKKYKRKEDKNGNVTNEPIDDFNHAMDGGRYFIQTKLWLPRQKTKLIFI